jgi:hypothetical protein
MRKKISSKVISSVPLISDNVFEYLNCSNTIHPKTNKSSSGLLTYTWTLHKVHASFDDAYPAKFLDSFV